MKIEIGITKTESGFKNNLVFTGLDNLTIADLFLNINSVQKTIEEGFLKYLSDNKIPINKRNITKCLNDLTLSQLIKNQ